jgi:hypothetical protein
LTSATFFRQSVPTNKVEEFFKKEVTKNNELETNKESNEEINSILNEKEVLNDSEGEVTI